MVKFPARWVRWKFQLTTNGNLNKLHWLSLFGNVSFLAEKSLSIQSTTYFSCASTQLASKPKHRGCILQWNFTRIGWLWAAGLPFQSWMKGESYGQKSLGLQLEADLKLFGVLVCILKGTACAWFAGRSWAANLAHPWACLGPGVRFRVFLSTLKPKSIENGPISSRFIPFHIEGTYTYLHTYTTYINSIIHM